MPKEYSRTDRIAGLMQRELAYLIQYEIKDPRVKLVTISAVKVSRDLAHAKIYISQLSSEEEISKTVAVLNKAQGFLRTLLAQKMKLRTTPQLHFVHDASIAEGSRLSALIDQALEEDKSIKKKRDDEFSDS